MAYPREVLERVKKEVCREAQEMRRFNKIVPVSGKRMQVPAKGREIDVVFYAAERNNAPLILGFHGGGFLFGGCALNDAMWKETAETLGVNIASVEYRKSPDYQYMAAIEDAYDAAVYFTEHAETYHIDQTRISVMGCSAGANLAASLCIYAKQQKGPAFETQILLYPFLDSASDPDGKGEGSIQGPIMYVFNELHCDPKDARLPLVSPVYAATEELQGLPHAVICYADHDCLKAEGRAYAQKLRTAGVLVDDMVAVGMPHGFYESGFGNLTEGEQEFLGEDVKRMIREGLVAKASRECLQFIKKCIGH